MQPIPAITLWEIVFRLGSAALLGALVGIERERLERAAGMRTHAIVSVASAVIMLVSGYSFAEFALGPRDPTRMAAQVVSGIGFLGAGVIIFRRNAVRGLTTAASLWAVAGLGLAAGGGLIQVAGPATIFILLIQAGLRPLSRRFFAHHQKHRLALRLARREGLQGEIEALIEGYGVEIGSLRLEVLQQDAEERLELELRTRTSDAVTSIVERLRLLEGVLLIVYTRGEGDGLDSQDDAPD